MSLESRLARAEALIRQLQGALQGESRVRGTVSAAGAVTRGKGFTSVKNATGDYTVTFTTAFGGVPSVVVSAGSTAFDAAAKIKNSVAITTTAFSVYTVAGNSGVLTDSEFNFIAVG